jgi:hypothetical protein
MTSSSGRRTIARKSLQPAARQQQQASARAATDKTGPLRRRDLRLHVMMSRDEMAQIEGFHHQGRMPSLAAAVRELLRRGLAAEGN